MNELFSLPRDIWNHPANRGARMAAVLRALRWQCHKRLVRRPVDLDFHSLRLRCHPDSHSASRAIYFAGLPDYREMRFMRDYLRTGDRFIDVGANAGLYTLLALSALGPTGHIDAFEPQAKMADRLVELLTLNDARNVAVHRVALAAVAGQAAFELTGDDCTAHVDLWPSSGTASLHVETARLDECLADVPYAMAKFDIEGYEPFALRGAARLLARGNPPVLQVEVAGYSQRYGVSTPELIAQLERAGYYIAIYAPDPGTLQPCDRPWQVPVDNVLAICRAHEDFVLRRLAGRTDGAVV